MKKKIIIGVMALLSFVVLAGCSSNKLSGTYNGTINLLLVQVEGSYTFEGDKVTEKAEGEVQDKGTYKIEDNKLTMKFKNDRTLTATLSEDKKSFEADDMKITFTKEEK